MKRKILYAAAMLTAALQLSGCEMFDQQATATPAADTQTRPAATMVVGQTDNSLQRRFEQNEQGKMDAVNTAVMWSEKYQELSVQTEQLREKNTQFILENEKLKRDKTTLEAELKKTQTELAQANELLGRFQQELTQWKSDVLGFRDEIRQAQTAQLTALTKVLKLLGAETVQQTPPADADKPSKNTGGEQK